MLGHGGVSEYGLNDYPVNERAAVTLSAEAYQASSGYISAVVLRVTTGEHRITAGYSCHVGVWPLIVGRGWTGTNSTAQASAVRRFSASWLGIMTVEGGARVPRALPTSGYDTGVSMTELGTAPLFGGSSSTKGDAVGQAQAAMIVVGGLNGVVRSSGVIWLERDINGKAGSIELWTALLEMRRDIGGSTRSMIGTRGGMQLIPQIVGRSIAYRGVTGTLSFLHYLAGDEAVGTIGMGRASVVRNAAGDTVIHPIGTGNVQSGCIVTGGAMTVLEAIAATMIVRSPSGVEYSLSDESGTVLIIVPINISSGRLVRVDSEVRHNYVYDEQRTIAVQADSRRVEAFI